jgi:TonB-dependent receptor
MSETLSKRCRVRSKRWSAFGIICCVTAGPFNSAWAQDEATGDAADDAPPTAGKTGDKAAPSAEQSQEDAELAAADEAAMAEGAGDAELKRAPPQGKGVVWGSVKDTKFNEGVIDAQVQVVGRKEKTFANVDGGYRLELPPGKYTIRVSFELHQPARVDSVEVKKGEVTRIDFKLVPDETSVEEVVVEDEADLASTEGQALGRKRSAVVGDGIGRAEIAHTPDRNAAEAAQRVVGATIVGNRFVFVRGLGERYTNALLNGAPLPSTEPDRNSVPLDLFPSLVLDGLTIVKQFTPDMPADFAGGSVRITTREFPKQTLFQVSAYGAYNSSSTFRSLPSYYGSSSEWLGYDGGRRAFPSGIPDRKLDGPGDSAEELGYAHRLNSAMGTQRKIAPPNFGVSVVAGDAFKLNASTKLGAMLALTYSQSYQLRKTTAREFTKGNLPDKSNTLLVGDEFTGEQGIESVRWGTFGSLALERNRNTTIKLVAFHSQSADDQTTELEGHFAHSDGYFHTNHLEYVSRGLNFVQLGGEHRYPELKGLEISWRGSMAVASRNQPDTRDTRYQRAQQDGVDGWAFVSDSSGQHSFLKQSDTTRTFGLDVMQPLIESEEHHTSIKLGTMVTSRDREFRARRFQLAPAHETGAIYDTLAFCPGTAWDSGCPNRLFRREAVRPDGLLLNEWTLNFDQYVTGLDVYALYAMIDSKLTSNLRAITGVRTEVTYQAFSGFNPFDRAGTELRSHIFQNDLLPALSLVYAIGSKSNARLGLSQTLARPQLRELSPSLATSYSGDRSVQGNSTLVLTKITNVDLRYEYFPTLKEVLALSLFYKQFKNPIEEVVGGTDLTSFANAPKAYLYGVELEGRKGLDVLADALKNFTLIANLTLVKSEVDLGTTKATATEAKRPLSYQSPWVVNLSLDYENEQSGTDARVLYNVLGPRITVVGANNLPDTYELPRNQLDLTAAQKLGKRWQLKVQAQNVLAQPVIFAYRDRPAYRLITRPDGSQTYESLGRTPAVSRYNPGSVFTLSASYTY